MATQKRIPVLETFSWQPPVLEIRNAPPGSPSYGDRYIIGADGSGVWSGKNHQIATWSPNGESGFWLYDVPSNGWEVKNIDDGKVYHHNGTVWQARPATGDFINARESSTDGKIPTWNGTEGDELNDGHTFRTEIRATGTADDESIPSEKAVRDAIEAVLGAADAMIYKGVINCSGEPNYPAADAGHTYKVSVAGKIGGALGEVVEVGDMIICITDGTDSGTQAAVGSNWNIIQVNIDGAVTGPASATDEHIAVFDQGTGKVIKDSGVDISDVNDAISHIDDDDNPHSVLHSQLSDVSDNKTHAVIDTHIDTANIHRAMTYSANLKSIIYEEA